MRRLLILLPALVALLAWAPSVLARDFSYDDREAIVANPVVEGALPWTAAFDRDYWHHLGDAGMYRPLATLSLRADRAQFGTLVTGYHAKNLFLALVVVGLATALVLALLRRPEPALLGLAVFAAHPALADAVAWISGRTSMLAALGGLAGALGTALALRVRAARAALPLAALAASAGLLLGLLGKEEAIVFAPLCLLIAARRSRAALASAAAGLALGLGAYMLLRWRALGAPFPVATRAPLADLPLLLRLRYAGRALLEALRLALAPVAYPPNYRAAPGFRPDFPPTPAALLGLLVPLAAAALGLRLVLRARGKPGGGASVRRAAGLGLLLAVLAWLPFLEVFPAGEVLAPRFLYFPLLLAAPAVGLALARLPRWVPALVLPVLIGLAWSRTGVYSDREHYARAILAQVPGDAGAWNDLGLALEEAGDVPGAARAWQAGLQRDPGHSRLWSNLGRQELVAGRLEDAERSLQRAVACGPANAVARCNLGAVLLRLDRPADAGEAYRAACGLAPGMAPAWRGLANALTRTGDLDEARSAVARAAALDPGDRLTAALAARIEARADGAGAATPASAASSHR